MNSNAGDKMTRVEGGLTGDSRGMRGLPGEQLRRPDLNDTRSDRNPSKRSRGLLAEAPREPKREYSGVGAVQAFCIPGTAPVQLWAPLTLS